MRIGIMGRSLRDQQAGVGRYTANLVASLAAQGEADLVVFLTRSAKELPPGRYRRVFAPLPTPSEYLRALWEQTLVPLQAGANRLDLYHSPNYILPFGLTGRSIVTVHDVVFKTDPSLHTWRSSLYLSLCTGFSVRRAAHIITVSDYTKRELLRVYPAARGKVTTIYQGLDPLFEQQLSQRSVGQFREERGLAKPYILYVGTVEPRKNLVRLLHAFEEAAAGGLPHDLIICGRRGWLSGPVMAAWEVSPFKDRVKFSGFVPNDELPYWYSGADLFVYPSLSEGFGLPPLEAMACGTPVVTSNTSALPEAVGNAALMVEPTSVSALAEAMSQVLSDRGLADRLREGGREQALRFRWAETATKVMALYRGVAEGSKATVATNSSRGARS